MDISRTNPGRGLLFKKGKELDIKGFTDADYAGSINDRRSTTGYCVFLGENLVSWRSKKQSIVARSSADQNLGLWPLGYVNCYG